MFFKRLAAFALTLVLLVGLTACKSDSQNTSLNNTTSASATVGSKEDPYTQNDNTSTTDVFTSIESGSSSENVTSADNTQDVTDSNPSTATSQTPSQSTVTSSPSGSKNEIVISCSHSGEDPYKNVNKTEFYANYKTACCNLEATYRSKHGLLSGSLTVPGQYATETQDPPKSNGQYIRNTATIYLDNGNTYVVLDERGNEAMRIHKAGGYITLEEVAAYMYAFGGNEQIPANYTSSKKTKPSNSIWGEYLRVNHSYFLGDTDRYPYEPELPDISGCGGDLRYYEMDIGTTGTETPGYAAKPYIQGNKVNRGAARIVYARQDLNGNGIYENNEIYVFYTHNHYNDFREYLNYFGGWGQMFGNVTGGGEYSSKTNANPTPYVKTAYSAFRTQ
ncbi:MAG: hypothetical protein IJN65_00870 [Clostridia bacterium]|nr:hypothetical protein [Clostridia bacterium]